MYGLMPEGASITYKDKYSPVIVVFTEWRISEVEERRFIVRTPNSEAEGTSVGVR
jgi:hypothetical protein